MLRSAIVLGLVIVFSAGCRQSTGGNTGCDFFSDTLAANSTQLDLSMDSLQTYSCGTILVNPDSILKSLCTLGISVDAGYFDADYRCMDPRGPEFVVVLRAPDSRMAGQNFTLGNNGKFACATRVVRYRPLLLD